MCHLECQTYGTNNLMEFDNFLLLIILPMVSQTWKKHCEGAWCCFILVQFAKEGNK